VGDCFILSEVHVVCAFCHRALIDCLCRAEVPPEVVQAEPCVRTMKSPEVVALEDRMALIEKSLLSQVQLNKIMMDRLAELEMRLLHESVR
jgi:hypothetical protein